MTMTNHTGLPVDDIETPSRRGEAAAFRARVEERLKNLETQFEELKSRINSLLFLIAGTAITQVLLRLLG